MTNNELIFEVLVMDLNTLEKAIEQHNQESGTNFEIIKEVEDELDLAVIKVSNYNISDIFYLGYGLSCMQYYLKDKGEFDFWLTFIGY